MVWTQGFLDSIPYCLSRCSTPYGINGLDTYTVRQDGICLTSAQRLTASMVWTHSNVRRRDSTTARAQRLTASMVWTPATVITPTPIDVGAQRLTASMVWTPAQFYADRRQSQVLNALRHQWFGHWPSFCNCSSFAHVLNALRHQWFGHGLGRDTESLY